MTTSGLGQWTARASMPTGRAFFAGGTVNGASYFFGGESSGSLYIATNEYNATADAWTTNRPMPTARNGVAVAAVGNVLYVADGYGNAGNGNNGPLNVLEAYDTVSSTWTTKAPAPTQRSSAAAGVVNSIVYVVGGAIQPSPSTSVAVATVEAYDPTTNAWTTKASMPTARTDVAVGAINGLLYAVGGYESGGVLSNKIEAYDPSANSWSTKAPMPTARRGLAVGVLGGVLYAVGGSNSASATLTTVEAYDPTSGIWMTKAPLGTGHAYFAMTTIATNLFAVGGYGNGTFSTVNEAYSL